MRISRRLWLYLILLAAFALRLYRLGLTSLWYDETVSLYLARQDLAALTRHTAGDIHPPFYYYLLHGWGGLAGWSEFSSAFLSLFFGVLLIALVYRVGQEWTNRTVAFVAASLVAFSPYNLWYSQEVRMYTLGAALGLVSVWLGVRVLRGQSGPAGAQKVESFARRGMTLTVAGYAVAGALGLYTLYYFAFLLVFINLVAAVWFIGHRVAARARPAADVRRWVVAQIAVLILYGGWLAIAVRQAIDPPVPPWRSATDVVAALFESFSALTLGQSADPAVVWPALVLTAVALAAAVATQNRRLTDGPFLLGYALVPLLVILGLSAWKPLYHVRYMFIYSAGFYLLLALGLVRLWEWTGPGRSRLIRVAGPLLAALTVILLATAAIVSDYNFWFNPRYAEDDLRGAVGHIAERWRPGDAILLDAGYTYTGFDYYNRLPIAWRGRLTEYGVSGGVEARQGAVVLQTGSIGGSDRLGWSDPESDFYATNVGETRAALDRVFAAHPRVWLLRLYDTVVDPEGVIREYLAQHGRLIEDEVFTGASNMRVQGYLTSRVPLTQLPPTATSRPVLVGGRIRFLGLESVAGPLRAGDPLDTVLYWSALQPTNVDERLFVGLYSEEGQLAASTSELPIGNALGTSRWAANEIWSEPVRLHLPAQLPPGGYALRIALYDPYRKETLDPEPGVWVTPEGQILLSRISIIP